MHAGSIGLLESPASDPLDSWAKWDDHPPVLVVERTQGSLDAGPAAQTGKAAGRIETTGRDVHCGTDGGEPYIDVERTEPIETVVTDWVADVTGSGLVVAASVAADDKLRPFPFDLLTARTGRKCNRQQIDVEALGRSWANDGVLSDVWMAGDRVGDAVNIRYHNTTTSDAQNVNLGLGFERTYGGSTYRGVCYRSGYVAVWRDCPPSEFVQFVTDELLPFCERYDPDEHTDQADFDSFGGSD